MPDASGGVKYDGGKIRWDLLPVSQTEDVVKVLTVGARKYADSNWMKVENPVNRYYAACLRHITAWRKGERRDPETGLPHLAHAVCCLLFLMWFDDKETDENKEVQSTAG